MFPAGLQEAAQKFAKNNPKEMNDTNGNKNVSNIELITIRTTRMVITIVITIVMSHVMSQDFEEYKKNAWDPKRMHVCLSLEVREAATAAATALEKAHAQLKKEATEIPKKALHGAEAE